ncbi:MAG: NAD-dependent epimerase/dehydratase family protein [Candidatus Baltobacteraceae bacterium]
MNLITGGAGFLGSHLVDALVDRGDRAIVVDNVSTGHVRNLEHGLSSGRATFVYADVAVPYPRLAEIVANATKAKIDRIYHLASPGGPQAYRNDPWGTLAVNGLATMSLIELALEHGARFLFASSAAVYADPLVHPQTESDGGNVAALGPRSAYDEGKRFGEAAVAAAVRSRALDGRIARLFNCYGPGIDRDGDGLVPALIDALLEGNPLPIHGNGRQRRSLLYVDDAVELIVLAMESVARALAPIDVGSDDERSVEEIARTLVGIAGMTNAPFAHLPARLDDPRRRRPDLTRAASLGWSPSTGLADGLRATYNWVREARLVFA